jgi:hypothetical protein
MGVINDVFQSSNLRHQQHGLTSRQCARGVPLDPAHEEWELVLARIGELRARVDHALVTT